jgi:hypothetical protein
MQIPMPQKTFKHTSQAKPIEFMAWVFGDVEHLSNLNDASNLLAKDKAGARAWELPSSCISVASCILDACDVQTIGAGALSD